MDLKLHLLLVFVVVSILTHGITAYQPLLCQLSVKKGPCFGAWRRYTYNSASGQCERFIYHGCQDFNNFRSMAECEYECKDD